MPFRDQDIVELCGPCREPATGHCKRCHLPLCSEHAPGRKGRCESCEAYFEENAPTELTLPKEAVRRSVGALVMLPAAVGIWAVAIAAAVAGAALGGVGLGVLGFGGGFFGASVYVKKLYDLARHGRRRCTASHCVARCAN